MGSGLGCGRLFAGWVALGVLAASGFAQTQEDSVRVRVQAGDPPAMASVPGEDEGPGGAVYDVRARLHREGGLPVRWMAKQLAKKGVKKVAGAAGVVLGAFLGVGGQALVDAAIPDGRCGVDMEITAPASPDRPFNRATDWAFGGDWALDIPFDPQGFTSPGSGAFLSLDKAFPPSGPWDEREFVRAGSALSVTAADELSCTGATLEAEFEFEEEDDHGDSAETATEISLGESVPLRLETEEDEDWFRFELGAETLIKAAAFPEGFDLDSLVSWADFPRSPWTEIVSSTGSCSERIDPTSPYGSLAKGSPSNPCRSAYCTGGGYGGLYSRDASRGLSGQVVSRCSAGVYFVRVTAPQNPNLLEGAFSSSNLFAGVGKYTLRVWQDDHSDDYPVVFGGYRDATVVSVGSSTQGRIETPADEDVFEFETTGAPNRRTIIQVEVDTDGLSGWVWQWEREYVNEYGDRFRDRFSIIAGAKSGYEDSNKGRHWIGVKAVLAGRNRVVVSANEAGYYTLHVRQIEDLSDDFCVDRDRDIILTSRPVRRWAASGNWCLEEENRRDSSDPYLFCDRLSPKRLCED